MRQCVAGMIVHQVLLLRCEARQMVGTLVLPYRDPCRMVFLAATWPAARPLCLQRGLW